MHLSWNFVKVLKIHNTSWCTLDEYLEGSQYVALDGVKEFVSKAGGE